MQLFLKRLRLFQILKIYIKYLFPLKFSANGVFYAKKEEEISAGALAIFGSYQFSWAEFHVQS